MIIIIKKTKKHLIKKVFMDLIMVYSYTVVGLILEVSWATIFRSPLISSLSPKYFLDFIIPWFINLVLTL